MRYFLLSWDCEGFECVQDITAHHPDNFDKERLMEALKGNKISKNPLLQQLSAMTLRARFNSQRNPEIYIIGADDDIDIDAVRVWSETDPQGLVDWTRVNHFYAVWKGEARPDRVVIR